LRNFRSLEFEGLPAIEILEPCEFILQNRQNVISIKVENFSAFIFLKSQNFVFCIVQWLITCSNYNISFILQQQDVSVGYGLREVLVDQTHLVAGVGMWI